MSDESYHKCKTCRFCLHSSDIWLCTLNDQRTMPEEECDRYRPGSCENCSGLKMTEHGTHCTLTGAETDTLDVCDHYDPCGRRSI